MMDLKIKGSKWVGNIYQKFEAVCHEVDDMVKQDTFKYVEDQMQSVGDNVKKVCSNLLPHLGNSVKPVAEDVASEKIVEPVLSKLMSPDGEEPFSEFSYGEFAQSDHVNRPADLSEQKSSRDCLHDGAECVSDDPIKMYPGQQLSFFSSQHNHVEKLGSPASKDTIMRSESESSDVNIKEFSTILYASVLPDANSSSVVELFTESPMRVFDQRNDTDRHADLSKNKPGTSTHEMSIESLQNWTLWDDYVDEVERVPDALQSTSEMSFSVVSTENTGEGATLASFIRYDAEESSIISDGLPENLNHEEICCHNSVDRASIVAKFSDAAHETFEHSLECQLDSAALDADDSDCDSVDSSVVCSVVSEDTSIKKIGMTSFNCSSAEPVGLSEGPSEKLLREAILFKYVDDSSSDVAYSHTESIELHDKVQIQENCLNVEDSVLRAISQRVRKQRSLKKQILDAFTSKKRLAKEYEQLAIWFGDASLDSSQESNPHENNSGTHQAEEREGEGDSGLWAHRLSLELAKLLNGKIIRYIGDLTLDQQSPRQEVPHHLVDILHPSEDYSVGQFYEDARKATRSILDNGRVPIVTGGTGLYLRWFVYGKPDVPKASKEIASEAYSELADLERNGRWDVAVQLVIDAGDPKAELLADNDWYRLRCRLEIIKSSGSPPSAFEVPYESFRKESDSSLVDAHDFSSSAGVVKEVKSKDLDYDFICFFLSNQRVDLYRAIDWRCEDMVSGGDGILSEARWLLDVGLLPNSNSASRAIGYRQAMEYLLFCREQGGSSSPREFQKFLAQFQKASRNFAKRQLTWFRNEDIYHWLDASKPLDSVLNSICDAYHDQTGNWVVPESLKLKKDLTSRREEAELKSYRTRNRHFIKHEDCSDILDWIQRTQSIQSDTIIHT